MNDLDYDCKQTLTEKTGLINNTTCMMTSNYIKNIAKNKEHVIFPHLNFSFERKNNQRIYKK